jgi:hypothetical protein
MRHPLRIQDWIVNALDVLDKVTYHLSI